MSNPVQLIVAAFNDENTAAATLKDLKAASKEGLIRIENAAVLRKDAKGKLHIKETHDLGGKKGAALGGVVGAGIGLVAGAALVAPLAVGALVGGLAAKLRDSGFSNDRLEMLGGGLTLESSAIVAVVEHTWVERVQRDLEEAGADLVTLELQTDIADQLEAGHDVAYSALATAHGLSAGRVAGDENTLEGGSLYVDDDYIAGSQFVATQDGFAVMSAETERE